MDGLAIRVRKALHDNSIGGFLTGAGFVDDRLKSLSFQTSSAHADLRKKLNDDADYNMTEDTPFRRGGQTLVEVYQSTKRKITLQRERSYYQSQVESNVSNNKVEPCIETFRFSKNGVDLTFIYTFHHQTRKLIMDIECNQEDLKQEIEKSLLRLPQNTPVSKILSSVYQQLLNYTPPPVIQSSNPPSLKS